MSENSNKKYKYYIPYVAIGFVGLVLLSIPLLGILYNWIWYDIGLDNLAKIGDSFGVINTIASSAALIVVVISVLIQSRELKAQQDELRLSRDEYVENRITNIVYKQVEKVESAINSFAIINKVVVSSKEYEEYKSYNALNYISKIGRSYSVKVNNVNISDDDLKHNAIGGVLIHFEKLSLLITRMHNYTIVVIESLNRFKIKDEVKNQHKELFFLNVGQELIEMLQILMIMNIEIINNSKNESKITRYKDTVIQQYGVLAHSCKQILDFKEFYYENSNNFKIK